MTQLPPFPPPARDREIPGADDLREHLLREFDGVGRPRRRVPAPLLTAAAVLATLLLASAIGVVLRPDDRVRPADRPITTLPELLARVTETTSHQNVLVARPAEFVFVRTTDANGGVTESWYSVDGSRQGLMVLPGNLRVPIWPTAYPQDRGRRPTTVVDEAVEQPTAATLAALDAVTPTPDGPLLTAVTRGSTPEQAFDKLRRMLSEGGALAPPAMRLLVYRVAARIPGARLVPDAVDQAGRHGPAIAVGRRMLIIDRGTGAVLGDGDQAYLGTGVAPTVGRRPSVQDGTPVPIGGYVLPFGSLPAERIDWSRAAVRLPASPLSLPPGPGQRAPDPVVVFRDGVDARPDGTRFVLDLRHSPPVYGDWHGHGGFLTLRVERPGKPVAYLVIAVFGIIHDPHESWLVTWIEKATAAPRVSFAGGVVRVNDVGYRWNGRAFVRA